MNPELTLAEFVKSIKDGDHVEGLGNGDGEIKPAKTLSTHPG